MAGRGGAQRSAANEQDRDQRIGGGDSILSRRRRSAAPANVNAVAAAAAPSSSPAAPSRLPSPAALLNLLSAFAAGVAVGEWTRQSRVNRRRRRQDRLLCGVSSLAHPPGRHVVVVTTAALPWRTGTAVNPALRAAHLAARGMRATLLVPWLPPPEQPLVYPPGVVFQTPEEQAEHVVADARKRAGLLGNPASRFRVAWYDSRYFPALGSILPTGDVTGAVPAEDAAAGCAIVLEEPEHLTWFAHRTRWTSKFPHVVGVMHTNYLSYVASGLSGGAGGAVGGAVASSALYRINKWTCRLHCHKVIKLSDAVQQLPRQVTCNVHGVASCFLEQGAAVAAAAAAARRGGAEVVAAEAGAAEEEEGAAAGAGASSSSFTKGAYFIGKAVWGKGWRELVELLDYVQQKEEQQQQEAAAPAAAAAAAAGGGEDLDAIRREAEARDLRVSFKGPADHSDASVIGPYRVFLNPSTSDVVATTTAEALAMGKWVVVEELPCNEFFRQFDNCLIYRTPDEFAAHLSRALRDEPSPMTRESLRALTWEAATERFLRASEVGPLEWPGEAERRYGALLWRMYRSVTGFRLLRQALGLAPEAVVEGAAPDADDGGESSEFERVAAIEEADLLFSKGPEWFRSHSGGVVDGEDGMEAPCGGAGVSRRMSLAGA